MQLADALVSTLRDLGLRYLFGVSGANIEHVHDAVYRLGGDQFQTVMTKSEFGAAFMADVRARVHRTLGVCCATSGGGMMNLAVGIAESYAQEVPVLALVGQPPLAQEGRGVFQDSSGVGNTVNAVQLWRSIAKYVCKITDATEFWPGLSEALRQPFSGRCGPAVMLIPRDLMTAEVGERPADFSVSLADYQVQPALPLALPLSVPLHAMWQDLARARAPLLVVGAGVARAGAQALVEEWVNKTGVQVVTTLACSNAFPQEHPQYLGMIGAAGHPSAHDFVENEADFILAVGTQLRAMNRATLEHALARKTLAVINVATDALDSALKADHVISLGAQAAMQTLLELQAIKPLHWNTITPDLRCQSLEEEALGADVAGENGAGVRLHAAVVQLQAYLPRFRHLLFDAGNCATAAAHYLRMPAPMSTTIALGMGGMGYAIAGAVGAQLGETAGRTLVLGGDGAFLMTGLEMHTAVDLQLPILWVVFNNNQHGMCVTRQQLYFDGRIEGNRYTQVNIAQIARGIGGPSQLWCRSVTRLSDLDQALQDYLARSPGPGLLEIKIHDPTLPPFMPFVQASSAAVLPVYG